MNQTTSEFVTVDKAILKVGRRFCKDFSMDDPLRYSMYRKIYQNLIFNDVSLPFSRQDEANPVEADLPIGKGLLIVHTKGVGVSTFFQTLQRMFRNTAYGFNMTTAFDISRYLYNKRLGPRYVIGQYGYKFKEHLVIDEGILGLFYDMTIDFMKELINERYRLYQERGFKTHFCFNYTTTWNDSESQVKDMLINVYGLETYNQLMDMTNLIVWQGVRFKDAIPDRAPRINTYLKERSVR